MCRNLLRMRASAYWSLRVLEWESVPCTYSDVWRVTANNDDPAIKHDLRKAPPVYNNLRQPSLGTQVFSR